MKKISIILISIVLLLLASSCDGQVFSELMDTETQTIDYTTVPLTLEFTADGELSFINLRDSLQYSINGGAKTNAPDSIDVKANDIVRLYAEAAEQSNSSYLKINCTSDCYVYGNVMSLLDPDNFATNTEITVKGAFLGLFLNNTHIKNHETKKLVLPATTLAESCYEDMFSGCTSLEVAPELPATTLAESCYLNMFYGCTGLTKAPELPATTLANYCYAYMFYNCIGLTKAPELPATTLAHSCYEGMFSDCASLISVTCLATDISAGYCTTDWLKGVSPSGTFTKASAMNSWESGSYGIPSGWDVEDKQ